MSQYRIISTWHQETADCCEHCGRGIKNIALLENTVTGDRMMVGLTCLGKIMNLNEKFDKAVQSEIKKYYKLVTAYQEVKNFEDDYKAELKKGLEGRTVWDDRKYGFRPMTERDIINPIVGEYLNKLEKLIKKTIGLNDFSKNGMIQLENEIELKKEYNKVKNQYGFCGNDYKI